ncbi:PREDICTED: uncharacterized protein LOC105136656 [Populus euphratica]|uniref:Uncharacterized protein LOC105136656 n=1 Tax=Populus euphratica TaxID=75702 RepID=A0AAJ6V3E4_POPEU|nr:PREDICTED: uncharacterized protein LOC105136656 [Populus euphratica]
MNFLSNRSSQGASKGSKAPPSKGAEGTGSSFPSNSSKKKNPSKGNKASSDSQQPSSNDENPETHTKPALSQGADGKTTFKAKDLVGNISGEESQDWTFSEM